MSWIKGAQTSADAAAEDPSPDSTLSVIERARSGDRSAAQILSDHGLAVPAAGLSYGDFSAEERAILRQRFDVFLDALRRLRPADRQAIIWRVECAYSIEDIAGRLGKSIAGAAMTVSRALSRLDREMKSSSRGISAPPA